MSQKKKIVSLALTLTLYEPDILSSIYSFLLIFFMFLPRVAYFCNSGSSCHGKFSVLKEESRNYLKQIFFFFFRYPYIILFFEFSNAGE